MAPRDYQFIIIDDSKLDCTIAQKIVKAATGNPDSQTFLLATDALTFIRDSSSNEGQKTIILVDIRMPVMNGFEFVEAFEQFPEELQQHYRIFVLSSSINETDVTRARSYKTVQRFLNKPLTVKGLTEILEALPS